MGAQSSTLPDVRGKLVAAADMSALTWLRVGGPADVLFSPADEQDLAQFLTALDPDMPVYPVGVGSNLLVRDGGIRGVVVRLGASFANIAVEGADVVAGAASLDAHVAKRAAAAGIAGLEFYRGVPGTIGGALAMNAGAYGGETQDVLIEAWGVDRQGRRKTFSREQLGFSYRHCDAADDVIFTGARFRGHKDEPAKIEARMADIMERREASQPIRERTGGSTFANPDGGKSWQLIDEIGGRGRMVGGAQMSERHCNFMINLGDATAADLEALGESVRRDVEINKGVKLRWEIRRIGESREG
ncbi:MAG: UDP-N-acetylmuramate dehydrogenase [Pseudomonadota bacterium]